MRRLEEIASDLVDLEIQKRNLESQLADVKSQKREIEIEFQEVADLSDVPVSSIKLGDGWTVYTSLNWGFRPVDGDWDRLCDRLEEHRDWKHLVQRRVNHQTLGKFGREFKDEIGDVKLPEELQDVLQATPYRRVGYRKSG